jgi:WD40 repeat protein
MKYAAFISYSHTEDERLGVALQRALERFATPWYRPGGRRVFRDDTDLAANPSLWTSIREALDQSEYLVVLLSPSASVSPWVDREVEQWLSVRSAARLVLAITRWGVEEEPGLRNLGAFRWAGPDVPPSLRGALADEPRPVDLRWARREVDLSLRNSRFRDAVAELAAPILGRAKAELVGEHLRQRRLFHRVAAGMTTLVAAALTFGWVSVERAAERGRVAASQALVAQAQDLLEQSHDLALLLSIEAVRTHPTPEARAGLLTALADRRELQYYLRAGASDLTAADMSADGNAIAAGTRDGQVIVWDLRRGKTGRVLNTMGGAISRLAFTLSADRLAVLAGSPPEVAVLDLQSGVALWRAGNLLTGSASAVLALDRAGRLLVVGGTDGTLTVARMSSGEAMTASRMVHPGGVLAIAFHPRSTLLASGGWDGAVRVWDLGSGREIHRLLPAGRLAVDSGSKGNVWRAHGDSNAVLGIAFSPDGEYIESYIRRGLLVLWETTSGDRLRELYTLADSGFLRMGPDGRALVFEKLRTLIVWDAVLEHYWSFEWLHRSPIMGVGLAGRWGRLVSVGGSQASVLDLEHPRSLGALILGSLDPTPRSGVFLNQDASLLAYADSTGAIRVWSVARRFPVAGPLRGHEQIANRIAFSPDGKTLASGADDGLVLVWDLQTGDNLWRLKAHPYGTAAVAFSPDGRVLAAAGQMTQGAVVDPRSGEVSKPTEPPWQLLLWDVSNGKPLGSPWPLSGYGPIWDVAFSPDGRALAVGASEGTTLWSTESRRVLGEPMLQAGLTAALAFAEDGRLASAAGSSISIRDPGVREGAASLVVPFTGTIQTVAISPDGRMAAFSGDDGSLILWDVDGSTQLGPTLRMDGAVWDALSFQENGRALVSAGPGGVAVWDLNPDSWIARACAVANRTLTEQEWRQYMGASVRYRPGCLNEKEGHGPR